MQVHLFEKDRAQGVSHRAAVVAFFIYRPAVQKTQDWSWGNSARFARVQHTVCTMAVGGGFARREIDSR